VERRSNWVKYWKRNIGARCEQRQPFYIKAWGSSSSGGSGAPNGTFVNVFSTDRAFAALKADGTIIAWGDSRYGDSGVPSGSFVDECGDCNNAAERYVSGVQTCGLLWANMFVFFLACKKTWKLYMFTLLLCIQNAKAAKFSAQKRIPTQLDGTWSVYAADIDGDGDMDVLSASVLDYKIAWYENTDGKGTFSTQKTITTNGKNFMYATDIDGDGDMDVLSASQNDVTWYENTDGKGTFSTQKIITTQASGATSVYAADMDGDGDMDVLSAGDDKIAWYENTDGKGTFNATQKTITTQASGTTSVYAADMDGDGDMDVLSASFNDNKIAWYENTDGKGTFSTQKIITTQASGATSVYAADIDGDGDMDVLSASRNDNKVAWYENTDGKGTFSTQKTITTQASGAQSVYAADTDGDGDMDVLSASLDGKIAWYDNTDGEGTFSTQKTIATQLLGPRSVYAADIDGDGDMDVLSASWQDDTVAWYENTDRKGVFSTTQKNITTQQVGGILVSAADIDGDGDMDVLRATGWHENLDGKGNFGNPRKIGNELNLFYAADIDGDGDMDVLSASSSGKISWYENTDGKGTFNATQKTITTQASGATSVYAADMDGDGDMDVLSASFNDNKIAWYENTDGKGTFSTQKIITTQASGAQSVYAADMDGDGDMDVLSASLYDNKIAWYENTDGKGTFSTQKTITTQANGAHSVYAADIDGDGDMDVISASTTLYLTHVDNKVAWYENTDGKGAFSTQKTISTQTGNSVCVADVDGDGDMDVLSTSNFNRGSNVFEGKIAWYENTDGKGTFGTQNIITTQVDGANFVYAADIDGDGDMDVLSCLSIPKSPRIIRVEWYKNVDCVFANTISAGVQTMEMSNFHNLIFPENGFLTLNKTVSIYMKNVSLNCLAQ